MPIQPSLNAPTDPFSHPSMAILHLSCTSCGTAHCRGCLKVVRCRDAISTSRHAGSSCSGGGGCALWSCCTAVRAVAIWEALKGFDWVFGVEAGFMGVSQGKEQHSQQQQQGYQHSPLGKQHREAYVKLLISKADKSMRRFEDAFVRTLRVVCSWLQPSSADDESVDYEQAERDREAHEALLAHLFSTSYLLEVVHAFLSNNNVRDWIAHSETYLVILEMLRKMGDCGLGSVLSEPVGVDSATAPSAVYNPFVTQAQPPAPPMSLCDLVKQLEAHRRPLMALAAKVQFSATVEKVNNLCDAISYLLLQQVLGGF